MNYSYNDLLEFLQRQAHAAGDLMRRYYRKDFRVYTKPDRSKVTDVDLAISDVVQEWTAREFPGIGLHSEESNPGPIEAGKDYFVIDELDGTSYFVDGVPGFSHQAAFFDAAAGQLMVGLVYYPLDDCMVYAIRGRGAWLKVNGEVRALLPPADRPFGDLRFAHPSRYSGTRYWDLFLNLGVEEGRVVMTTALRTLQFVQEQLDVAIFLKRRIPEWDWAGEKVILETLGFHHSYLDGRPIRFGEAPPAGNAGYLICPPSHRETLKEMALQHLAI